MNKDEIIARIREIKAERSSLAAEREETCADILTVFGRITALKTLWALMPQSYRDIIAKYTDATPE